MKCEYADCATKNHKNHIVKYGFYDGSQWYKCLNCNLCFIKQKDRERKGLTEYEKHIIDQLLGENISYRAIAMIGNGIAILFSLAYMFYVELFKY